MFVSTMSAPSDVGGNEDQGSERLDRTSGGAVASEDARAAGGDLEVEPVELVAQARLTGADLGLLPGEVGGVVEGERELGAGVAAKLGDLLIEVGALAAPPEIEVGEQRLHEGVLLLGDEQCRPLRPPHGLGEGGAQEAVEERLDLHLQVALADVATLGREAEAVEVGGGVAADGASERDEDGKEALLEERAARLEEGRTGGDE